MEPNKPVLHTPSYILRQRIILHLLRRYKPGRFLEIGCGRGDLLPYLARLGFEGVGLEISRAVLPLARKAISPYEHKLSIVADEEVLKTQLFQFVFAFEVLEHIRDDAAALVNWRNWLAPGGRLIITVPAHMKSWTASDDAVGHYRRYERESLCRLLGDSGYIVDVFWSYGFPLTAFTRPLRSLLYRLRSRDFNNVTKEDRTLRSSQESAVDLNILNTGGWYIGVLAEALGLVFHVMQLPFRYVNLGDSYLVVCRSTRR